MGHTGELFRCILLCFKLYAQSFWYFLLTMKVLSAEVKGLCSAAATALFTVIYSPDPLHSFSHGIKSIAMKRVSVREREASFKMPEYLQFTLYSLLMHVNESKSYHLSLTSLCCQTIQGQSAVLFPNIQVTSQIWGTWKFKCLVPYR